MTVRTCEWCFAALTAATALIIPRAALAQPSALPQLDSSAFDHKYEGDVVLGSNYLPNYTPDNPFDLQDPATDGNILTYQSSIASGHGAWSSDQWPSAVSHSTGWTIDVRLKVDAGPSTLNSFDISAADGVNFGLLSIGQYTVQQYNVTPSLVTADNTDAFHEFRMAEPANGTSIYVWRDNVYLGSLLGNPTGGISMWFGDGASTGGGPPIELDYFRWDGTGAYAPVGQIVNVAGDLNGDGVVDLTDYGILTSHWLQQVNGESNGDLNGDGIVDITDFAMFKLDYQTFNGVGGAALTVPEPATLALVAVALPAFAILCRRKKHPNLVRHPG